MRVIRVSDTALISGLLLLPDGHLIIHASGTDGAADDWGMTDRNDF